MIAFKFSASPKEVLVEGRFDGTCTLNLSDAAVAAVANRDLRLRIKQIGNSPRISDIQVTLGMVSGTVIIRIGSDRSQVLFEDGTMGQFDVRLWRSSTLTVGRGTTSNDTRIVCDLSDVVIGEDCMFSDGVLIQAADQHGIIDLASGKIINNRRRRTQVADHVWLGRQTTLMPDVSVGYGSIVGAGAIVSKHIPPTSAAAGIPAKVVKTGTSWSRSPASFDAFSEKYVEDFQASRADHDGDNDHAELTA